MQCPVLRSDLFRRGIEDVRAVRETFKAGRGRLLDEEGIDWWDLTSLVIAPEAGTVLTLRRLAKEISPAAVVWATRSGWSTNILARLLERPLQTFNRHLARSTGRIARYARLLRHFPMARIGEIFLDKYDSGYRWRSRLASRRPSCDEPVVLVPSAYGNVFAWPLPTQGYCRKTFSYCGDAT